VCAPNAAARQIDVMVRKSPDYNNTEILTADTIHCLNLGSYNYLGFGDPVPRCTECD
jgi:hypothetical protein